jgi:hypothetical protein
MNLLCDITNFQKDNIFFLDTKRNMVIEGKFTKLIYSDFAVALNGLYLYCPIQGHCQNVLPTMMHNQMAMDISQQRPVVRSIFQFSLLDSWNIHLMKELTRIEHEIIEHYKDIFQIQKMNMYSLRNQMKMGSIKIGHNVADQSKQHSHMTLKISGVWETDYNVGITFKFCFE